MTSMTVTEALQAALAAEDAAIYGYGVVGAALTGARQAQARTAFAAHRARRDVLAAQLRDLGVEPAPAAPAYALPTPVTDAAKAVALAAHLELGVAATNINLVAAAAGARRRDAALAVQACAVRAAGWTGAPTAFPGLPDQAEH